MATVGEVLGHDKGERRHQHRHDPKSHPRRSAMWNKEERGGVFLIARALMLSLFQEQ